MKQDRAMTAIGVLAIVLSLLMMSVGKFIYGGITLLLAFGVFWNRGGGRRNDRSIYEKIVKTDLSIEDIYEKLRDAETPLGKAWITEHRGFPGDSIVFGPGMFSDCVVISRQKDGINIRNITKTDNIIRKKEDEYRFDSIIDTEGMEASPERYAVFAAFKLAAVVMTKELCGMIEELSENGSASVPAGLGMFRMIYHNSVNGFYRDAEGNDILKVDASYDPFVSKVSDTDGNEMASVVPHAFNRNGRVNDLMGYAMSADGEPYCEIKRFREKGKEGFICDTPDGEFKAVIFPSCMKANISCNYIIEHDGKTAAVIGGSPNLIFDNEGRQRNDLVLSYDDDYLVLYAALETFILTLNSGFLK